MLIPVARRRVAYVADCREIAFFKNIALCGEALLVALEPGFPQLLTPALRLGKAFVLFFPHGPLALSVLVAHLAVAHTNLQKLQAVRREAIANTPAQTQAEAASSS
jgi:hypothetical protein